MHFPGLKFEIHASMIVKSATRVGLGEKGHTSLRPDLSVELALKESLP